MANEYEHAIMEARKLRSCADVTDVDEVVETLSILMNPFKPNDIISLLSEMKASPDIEHDLLDTNQIKMNCVKS